MNWPGDVTGEFLRMGRCFWKTLRNPFPPSWCYHGLQFSVWSLQTWSCAASASELTARGWNERLAALSSPRALAAILRSGEVSHCVMNPLNPPSEASRLCVHEVTSAKIPGDAGGLCLSSWVETACESWDSFKRRLKHQNWSLEKAAGRWLGATFSLSWWRPQQQLKWLASTLFP